MIGSGFAAITEGSKALEVAGISGSGEELRSFQKLVAPEAGVCRKMDSLLDNFRQKKGLFLIIFLGLAALFFSARFILALQMDRLDYAAELLEAQGEIIEGCQDLGKDMRSLQAGIEKLEADAAAVKSAIPSSADLPVLAKQIYVLLKKHGLEGDRIVSGALVNEERYDYFTVSFSVEGGRENILGFLADLERLQRKVNIVELLLTSKGDNAIRATLQLETYVLLPPGKAPAEKGLAEGSAEELTGGAEW